MCSEITSLLSDSRRIHMLGIGGIGMAGLAFLLHQRGHRVSGSDLQCNRQTEWLQKKGIQVRGDVPVDVEWIIRTTAVPDSHPDVVSATVPVHRRGEVLPQLLVDRFTIAVSGTHGKTTTSAMIAQLLDCGYCIGGEVEGLDGVSRDGDVMVVEADESDGTVAFYRPDIAVITNIEYDHMEHHDSFDAFEGCFKSFITNTKEKVIYCGEDPVAHRLCIGNTKAVSYSHEPIDVSLPGRHNQLNACAALEVCRVLGREGVVENLTSLAPIARRFETVYDAEYMVISDYAHHPTEIRAVIDTAVETLRPKRLLGVFQPHRYTRTSALGSDFPAAFDGLDKLWLLPVYAASELPIKGGRLSDLIQHFTGAGWRGDNGADWPVCRLSDSGRGESVSPGGNDVEKQPDKNSMNPVQIMDRTWQDIRDELRSGDVLLIMGAGDIDRLAMWASE